MLTATELTKLTELRRGSSQRSELRILFALNPIRQAVLLVAGDKADAWNKRAEASSIGAEPQPGSVGVVSQPRRSRLGR